MSASPHRLPGLRCSCSGRQRDLLCMTHGDPRDTNVIPQRREGLLDVAWALVAPALLIGGFVGAIWLGDALGGLFR